MDYKKLPVPDIKKQLGLLYNSKTGTLKASVWSPAEAGTEDVKLSLYHKNDKTPFSISYMDYNKKSGIWSCKTTYIDKSDCFYEYEIKRNGKIFHCLDPYALSMEAYTNDGTSGKAALVDLNNKRAKPDSKKSMAKYELPVVPKEKTIIYEVSVRDFTISKDAEIPKKIKAGTYKAFIEKLPYLAALGVTHIQLMPVLNFYNNNELNQSFETTNSVKNNNYNWGYDPHNYFTPEGWFSSDPKDPYARIKELRELIEEAHKNGLRVTLDVVYNHMAKINFLNDIVPGYYFRQNEDGSFTSGSFCGNDTATERTMVRKLIVDSTVHWVKNYNVDGFRFDIMGLIDTETVLQSYEACKAVKEDVLFIGEGWKLYNGEKGTRGMDQNFMEETDVISVFNDEFRDQIRSGGLNEKGLGFVSGAKLSGNLLFCNMKGAPQKNYKSCSPCCNVQYAECHDGLTLHDNIKLNCSLYSSSPSQNKELFKRLKLANFIVLTSQGIPFLHSGQEYGRTKPALESEDEAAGCFVKNSYRAGDAVNQFIWTLDELQTELLEYTKSLITFRKNTPFFTLGSYSIIERNIYLCTAQTTDQTLVFRINYQTEDSYKMGANWYVIINGSTEKVSLPMTLYNYHVYADINKAELEPLENFQGICFKDNDITIDALSAFIVRAEN